MKKQEFLEKLRKGFAGLPQEDLEERLTFYSEMIDDRMEEGLTEEEAVFSVGAADEIVAQAVADIPMPAISKEVSRPHRRLKGWEILLLTLGSPIWLSLGIAAAAVIFSLYAVIWSVIASLWSVFGSFAACCVGAIVAGVIFAASGKLASGVAMLAAGTVCAGLSIFMLFGCRAATAGIVTLTKKSAMWIRNCFVKKEVVK